MERPLEGPDPYVRLLSSKEAGKWLGDISDDLFEKLMAEHLPTLSPVQMGKHRAWRWMDVAVLYYVISHANQPEK